MSSQNPDAGKRFVAGTFNAVRNTVMFVKNIKVIGIIVGVVLILISVIFLLAVIAAQAQTLTTVTAFGYDQGDTKSQIEFSDTSGSVLSLMDVSLSYLGLPYKFNTASSESADCSGFILMVFQNAGTNVILPHSANQQSDYGSIVFTEGYNDETLDLIAQTIGTEYWTEPTTPAEPGDITIWATNPEGAIMSLLPGDLLFFNYGRATSSGARIGHVGMYLGNGQFIHTSNATDNCCIKSLYQLDASGNVVWSIYAKSIIKITRILPMEKYEEYRSDLTGNPIPMITAEDAYSLAVYAEAGMPQQTDQQKYDKLVAVVNAARANGTTITTEVKAVFAIPASRQVIDAASMRLARLAIIGHYWILATPTVTPAAAS